MIFMMLYVTTCFQADGFAPEAYHWMDHRTHVQRLDPCSGDGDGGGDPQPAPPDPTDTSPILLDLDRDGFAFGGPESGIHYDLHGLGYFLHIQWVLPDEDDAFLAVDLNGNGVIDDGSELFGNGTRIHLGDLEFALNGFHGLVQWDNWKLGGNEDGLISSLDQIWSDLVLWNDRDADGVSTSDELISLSQTSIQVLDPIPIESKRYDIYGNALRFWSKARVNGLEPAGPIDMVDVYFKLLSKERSGSL